MYTGPKCHLLIIVAHKKGIGLNQLDPTRPKFYQASEYCLFRALHIKCSIIEIWSTLGVLNFMSNKIRTFFSPKIWTILDPIYGIELDLDLGNAITNGVRVVAGAMAVVGG